MEKIAVILTSGVVIVGRPIAGFSGGASFHGRRIELANATVFQAGMKTTTAGHIEIDGGTVAAIGNQGVTAV